MVCDTRTLPNETREQRLARTKRALTVLEAALSAGQVQVKISSEGAIAFAGWTNEQRERISDVCAYRKLQLAGSFALRQAVQRAEALQGRKVNERAIAAGTHSHDNGATWQKGH